MKVNSLFESVGIDHKKKNRGSTERNHKFSTLSSSKMSENVNKVVVISAKKQKLIDGVATDQQAIVSSNPNDERPRIFKLNIDCFDEIFDYLSTEDLLGIGQTCKMMQQVVGEYFKKNYTAASMFGGNDGIYRVFSINGTERAETAGFNKFIRK